MQTWFSRKKYVYPKIMSYHYCCRVAYARVVCLNNQEWKKKSVASSPSSSSSPWRLVASTPLYLSCCASRKWTRFHTFCLRHNAVRLASLRYIISVHLNTISFSLQHSPLFIILHSSLQNYRVSSGTATSHCWPSVGNRISLLCMVLCMLIYNFPWRLNEKATTSKMLLDWTTVKGEQKQTLSPATSNYKLLNAKCTFLNRRKGNTSGGFKQTKKQKVTYKGNKQKITRKQNYKIKLQESWKIKKKKYWDC